MTVAEILPGVRYVTDSNGEKTDVLVPFSSWQALLTAWDLLIDKLEDQEDRTLVQEWLEERRQGVTNAISLDELERELIIDGLLPSSNQ